MARKNIIGAWAFLIGAVLALIVGLFGLTDQLWITVLLLIGIIVGLLNIGGSELKDFMMAGAVLVIVCALAGNALLTLTISVVNVGEVFQALLVLFVPATIVVALKSIFALAKN